jgi:lysophospholipase L1-like esterase
LYSGIGGGTQNASTTTTGATIDLNTTLANTPDDETPHEMSYAISGVPSLVICAIGVNDGANSSFTGTTTSGSAVITGVSNANLFIAGYGLSGPGIPTGAVVGSTTASTVTMQVGGVNANATASGTSTLSLNVVESAWEAAYAKLINYALADGSKFICNTILPAPSWTSQSFRNDVNAWMLATYGTTALGNGAYSGTTPNVYVIDSATAFTGLLTSPGIYVDGVHLSAHGEQIWASSLNQGLATIFSSQMTGAPVTTTISVNAFGNLAAQSFDTWFGASSSVGATVEIGANNQYIGSNLQIGNLTFQSRGPINTPDFNFTGPNGNVLAEINPIPAGYFFADEPITTNNATTTVTFNAKGQNEFVYDKSTTTAYPTKTFVFPSLTTVGQTLEYTSTASISAITVSGGTFDDGSTFSSYTTGGPNAPVTVRWKATTTTGHFVREN